MFADILTFVIRTMFMYAIVFIVLRVMGKREIGKLSVFDLVISIVIAEIAVFSLEDPKRPLYEALVPMITLVIIQITLAFFSMKSRKFRTLFDGKPSVIIAKGELQRDEMKKQRYNLDDLFVQLRGQQINNIADVEFAILETNGQLSVIPKEDYESESLDATEANASEKEKQATANHQAPSINQTSKSRSKKIFVPKGKISYQGLPIPLIMDGKVQDHNLEDIHKTRFWLKNIIQQHGVKDFKDVFLCSIDHKGKIYIDLKK